MSPPRKKLALEEHLAIGEELRRIDGYFLELRIKLYCTYGRLSRTGREAARAAKILGELRSRMDDQLFADYPEEADGVYYGGDATEAGPPQNRNTNNEAP